MNKLILLSLAATIGAASFVLAPQGTSVYLQSTSPGTAQTGHLNISGTATVGLLKSQGTVFGQSTAPTGFAYGGFFTAASNQARGFYGYASSPTGLTYGGFFQNASDNGRAVYGLATSTTGFNYGGYFQTASTGGRGLLGVAAAPSGTTYGVYGTAVSPTGYGVYSDGKLGSSGPAFIGPRQTALGSNELLGLSSNSTSFTGMYISSGANGRPYYGYSNGTAIAYSYLDSDMLKFHVGTGTKMAIGSSGNVGIGTVAPEQKLEVVDGNSSTLGVITATNGIPTAFVPTAFRRGFMARTYGTGGTTAVAGYAQSSSGESSYGVSGRAFGSGLNYGVIGYAVNGSSNYAGYFDGNLFATSSSAGVKSFLIDHPQDPANKFLEHSSVESDERMNIYRGSVKTDSKGYASVPVPGWFGALNEDVKYQLTVVDEADSQEFVLVKVVQRLRDGTFRIRTSQPRVDVDWQLSARRHDPVSQYYPLQVERLKNDLERGRYLTPEAYGKDRSFGMAGSEEIGAEQNRQAAPRRKKS